MPPLFKFLARRLLAIPVTVLIVTALLYALAMQVPAQVRAQLYLSRRERASGNLYALLDKKVIEHGLNDPYPLQYGRWALALVRGDWGYSPSVRQPVLTALLTRTPVTVEVTLYAVLLFIPLGLLSGTLAGGRQNRALDHGFRALAFAGTAIPPFILALVLLAIFYTGLRWFPPDRLGNAAAAVLRSPEYRVITGLVTVDGLLNGRPDVAWDAARHLVLPVVTLSLAQWATVGRVMRVSVINELRKDYVVAARARGLGPRRVLWRHAFRNAAGPAFTTSALAAASLLTGVLVVEIVFNLHGVSEVITAWARTGSLQNYIPDTPAIMGFVVYSVLAVQLLMLLLDVVQAVVNPRFREGLEEA